MIPIDTVPIWTGWTENHTATTVFTSWNQWIHEKWSDAMEDDITLLLIHLLWDKELVVLHCSNNREGLEIVFLRSLSRKEIPEKWPVSSPHHRGGMYQMEHKILKSFLALILTVDFSSVPLILVTYLTTTYILIQLLYRQSSTLTTRILFSSIIGKVGISLYDYPREMNRWEFDRVHLAVQLNEFHQSALMTYVMSAMHSLNWGFKAASIKTESVEYYLFKCI